MDSDERRTLSERLLSRTLGWARATSARRDFDRPFSQWPILEKEVLRGSEEKFRKRSLLAIPAATSGSTGVPMRLWRSPRSVASEQAFIDSILRPFGLTFRSARLARLRVDLFKSPSDREPPFGVTTNGGKCLRLSFRHVGPETTRWYVDALKDFAPDILWLFPSTGEALARDILDQGLEVRVPIVLCGSEVLRDTARKLFEKVFGATVLDYYGHAERMAFAATTEDGSYLFNPAYGRVELRPVAGRSPAPGLSCAEIIATGFWNESMPLVRFRTGDHVICPASYDEDDLAEVALGMKPFTGIAGRDNDYVVSPRGEILSGMYMLPIEVGNAIRMQVIQESPSLVRINILANPGFGKADRKVLDENIGRNLPDDMKVEVCLVDRLEVSSSGKAPFVVRRFESPEAPAR
jgi:phenylacetate-CoA ligase